MDGGDEATRQRGARWAGRGGRDGASPSDGPRPECEGSAGNRDQWLVPKFRTDPVFIEYLPPTHWLCLAEMYKMLLDNWRESLVSDSCVLAIRPSSRFNRERPRLAA